MTNPHEMSGPELKDWLRNLLQTRGEAAAGLDARSGEAPYEPALRSWESGSPGFRQEFTRAVNALVKEARSGTWLPDPFHELATLIESTEMFEASESLEELAHASVPLENEHASRLPDVGLANPARPAMGGHPGVLARASC